MHLNLFYAAAGNIIRHKLRSIVVVLCLVTILFPFISAVSILEGVKAQSRVSVEEGADIYVTMDMYGRNGMIPISMADEIGRIEGVIRAVPRVISRIYESGKLAVLLGLPLSELEAEKDFIRGKFPEGDEVIIGKGMADALNLDINGSISLGVRIFSIIDHIPYMEKKVYRVSGIIDSDSGIWTSNIVLADIEDAIEIFGMEDFVSDIAVYVRPGYEIAVTEELQKMNTYFRIQTKDIARTYVERGFNRKGGIFTVLYILAFAVAVPVLVVVSGTGLSERRKEIGVLKATGWQTHEVLEMVFFENIIIALIGALASLIISYAWIKGLNGIFIAQIFMPETGSMLQVDLPSRFMPLASFLSFMFALILAMVGSIYTTWRASVVPPAEAMR